MAKINAYKKLLKDTLALIKKHAKEVSNKDELEGIILNAVSKTTSNIIIAPILTKLPEGVWLNSTRRGSKCLIEMAEEMIQDSLLTYIFRKYKIDFDWDKYYKVNKHKDKIKKEN